MSASRQPPQSAKSAVDVDTDPSLLTVGLTFIIASGVVALVALLVSRRIKWNNDEQKTDEQSESEQEDGNSAKRNGSAAKALTKAKWKPDKHKRGAKDSYEHPWLLATLKGHTGRVLDAAFSSNGKSLVTCADDRALFLWSVKSFYERERKVVRGNVELDHATRVQFAPDSKSVVISTAIGNKLAVYKLAKKDDQSIKFQPVESVEFSEVHKRDIVNVGIACNGRFLMSASSDNTLVVYSIQGDVLKTLETKQNCLHCASVSPCGRFVASSGFTPDVLVWEGHHSGVYSFDFNQNSSRVVTASKDGTWKLYDTDIRYQQGEEAHEIASGQWDLLKTAAPESVFAAISPSGDSFAIAADRHLRLYSAADVKHSYPTLEQVHGEIFTAVKFSSCGKYLMTAGDRQVRIFHNIPGRESQISCLKDAVKKASGEAHKRRLQEQIEENENELNDILEISE